jgi:hypothetical protein
MSSGLEQMNELFFECTGYLLSENRAPSFLQVNHVKRELHSVFIRKLYR